MQNLNYQYDNIDIGKLSLKRSQWLPNLKPSAESIHIVSHDEIKKASIAKYISTIYQDYYNANIDVNYPHLISLNDTENKILAAVGIRYASDEPLFLEQYLDQSIEQTINTPRSHIVEIGNLASNENGASLYLFIALSAYLSYQGYSKAVLTGTSSLQKRFTMLGLNPQKIASANPNLLNKKEEDWGSYYESDPHVLVGSIHESFQKLQCYSEAQFISLPNKMLAGGF